MLLILRKWHTVLIDAWKKQKILMIILISNSYLVEGALYYKPNNPTPVNKAVQELFKMIPYYKSRICDKFGDRLTPCV